jgi:hypothetical protein
MHHDSGVNDVIVAWYTETNEMLFARLFRRATTAHEASCLLAFFSDKVENKHFTISSVSNAD